MTPDPSERWIDPTPARASGGGVLGDEQVASWRERGFALVDGVLPAHALLLLSRRGFASSLQLLQRELGRFQFLERASREGRTPEAEAASFLSGRIVAAHELLARMLRDEPQELRASLRVRRSRVVVVPTVEPPGG